jgi:hypothetical protein
VALAQLEQMQQVALEVLVHLAKLLVVGLVVTEVLALEVMLALR